MDNCLYCGGCTYWSLLAAMCYKEKGLVCPHCNKEQNIEHVYKLYKDTSTAKSSE